MRLFAHIAMRSIKHSLLFTTVTFIYAAVQVVSWIFTSQQPCTLIKWTDEQVGAKKEGK